jgi:hypothetical protein
VKSAAREDGRSSMSANSPLHASRAGGMAGLFVEGATMGHLAWGLRCAAGDKISISFANGAIGADNMGSVDVTLYTPESGP